ncbi:MAG: hypothetical protein LBV03_04425 [Fusobacteriales bacterium]|nr:hypothetical protein [Fusobacteriales bacterium]
MLNLIKILENAKIMGVNVEELSLFCAQSRYGRLRGGVCYIKKKVGDFCENR